MKKILITLSALVAATVAFAAAQASTTCKPCKSACEQVKPSCCESCAEAGFATAFGSNYVSFGGFAGSLGNFAAAGADLELNINVFKCKNMGLDVALPLQYIYSSIDADTDLNGFEFPVALRPYYRAKVSDCILLTPYLEMGIGGRYDHICNNNYRNDNLRYVWFAGAGVEVSLCKSFYVTPKYEYYRDENFAQLGYRHSLGAEFGWKFAKNMTAVAEYRHDFCKYDAMSSDFAGVKIRYNF